ncbi:DtxR family transcriptional regulator [Clostridium polyendosporum]|uniref:Manganese transport regulator n=1 Tax=Clostridium polyendosporum TaxID=69208 RepID=A0A919S0L8_9CLOT|nr:iron dependent repressor, metal binding and dimerization domain protein [Clostridium polyendosporum]GIM29098.1 DtxR family transcriptional regulator [Clostridium polyendosporum]
MDNKFHTVRGYELKNYDKKLLTSAMEDYMEMIYRSVLDEGFTRINKLAQLLNVKDSSASKMTQKLSKLGLLNYEKYGIITLTDKGFTIGKFLLNRHKIIESFLFFLGCEEDVLTQTELIEHVINEKTVNNIEILNKFFQYNSDIKDKYISFKESYDTINKKID